MLLYTSARYRALVLVVLVYVLLPVIAADWPAFRHDVQRSAVTDEKLAFPLHLAWQYTCAQPPSPAWRPTSKLFNRMEFDYAPQPVVANGIVCFGSSSDDTIRALDATTGVEKWHYTTGGPVRFAPQIADGKVYAASDDGFIYCLDLVTGQPVWTFRAAPNDERLLGDIRMISRWPLRCGVLVDGGVVYTVAGMWPSEGVFIYALDAATGKMLWCNDTGGALAPWDGQATGGETYFVGNWTGLAPQGALLATRNELVIPQGQANPARIDRKTGKMLQLGSSRKLTYTSGPPFTMVGDKELIYTYSMKAKGMQEAGIRQTVPGTGYADLPQPSRGQSGMADPVKGLDVTLLATKERFYARQGYSIALVGETLLVGEDGAVAAYEAKMTTPGGISRYAGRLVPFARYDAATQRELWRVPVNGQARGLAVAQGRVYVTTDRGELYCFASEGSAPAYHNPATAFRAPLPNPSADATRDRLRKASMDRGYALVVGDPEGTLSVSLASRTALRIISVVADEAAARALRARLLATTALYGSRIHVFAVPKGGRLPFAQYFANAVIVAGDAGAVPATELYRLLHPCGGVLLCPGLTRTEAQAVLKASGAQADELRDEGEPFMVRGALPGALDWNSPYPSDQRLRAPLRPLWFGGPAPMDSLERGAIIDAPGPVASHGRFFHLLDGEVLAIDAYNGSELWRRSVPRELRLLMRNGEERLVEIPPFDRVADSPYQKWRKAPAAVRHFSADAESVYLTLGETCFRGAGVTCVKLNAATGEQQALYGPVVPSPEVSLKGPQTWSLKTDATHEGIITLSADTTGLNLELVTKGLTASTGDAWTLYFDFRPAARRYGLYERGVFQVRILPAHDAQRPATWRKGRGEAIPELTVTGTRAADGTATTVRLPWSRIEALTGARPKTFGFAASLRTTGGGQREGDTLNTPAKPSVERYLFGDPLADSLNNGWATIIVDDASADLAMLKQPAIIAGPLALVPAQLRTPSGDRYALYKPDGAASRALRVHPLTGDLGPRTYTLGNGCGMTYSSAFVHYMRSGTLGFFDLLDDSGIRHFSGLRPSCGTNMLAAFGVLFVNEDGSDCSCQYSFQVPFALANAEHRLHEDWATFTDRPVDNQVRLAAINLGAPGDRRDEGGTLWLNFPRFLPGLALPLKVEVTNNLGPYRVNADRVAIRNTDRPWIYTSQYRGISKATLRVDVRTPLVSQAAMEPPILDGTLGDAGWGEQASITLPDSKTEVFLRHDAGHLYIAACRAAVIGRDGKPITWIAKTKGADAPVWDDEAIELFFSDASGDRVVHLGVSPSGARFDALAAGAETEDARWNGVWQSAVTAKEPFIVEMAVPLATLTDEGLRLETLAVNVQANRMVSRSIVGEALCHLGGSGRSHCGNFIPLGLGTTPALVPRQFTVRLHFAELDDVKPGERVFDVKLQGQTILKDFDIAKEVGVRTALVKEFTHIRATDALVWEFVPKGANLTSATAPILSAIEVVDEAFQVPVATR